MRKLSLLLTFLIVLTFSSENIFAQCSNILSGKITAYNNLPLDRIEIVFTLNNNMTIKVTPNTNGDFIFPTSSVQDFEVLSANANIIDGNHLFGTSTLDLVLIQRHIVGLSQLENDDKYIAADVNEDNKITVRDLVELRLVILGFFTDFTVNGSLKEIPINGFQFPIKVSNCIPDKPFIELKLIQKGDVN